MNHLLDIGPKVGVLTVFLEDEDIFGNEASSVLSETLDPALASYRPKTRKTAAAYEKLLAFVQRRVGEVPADILRSAAEEVLSNMQNINLTGPDKRGNVLGVLGINTITNAEFGELVGISSQITDFDAAGGTGEFVGPTPNSNKEIDEESGVALLFDDDEDDNNMQSMGADDGIIGEIAEDNDAYEDRQGGGGAEETFRRRGVTLSGGREQSNEDMEPDEMGDSLLVRSSLRRRPQKNPLDLDQLSFKTGSRFMSNKMCKLPAKSWRVAKKGYEEVHVPPLKVQPYGKDETLKRIDSLPSWAQPAFAKMKSLNRIQSRVYNAAIAIVAVVDVVDVVRVRVI